MAFTPERIIQLVLASLLTVVFFALACYYFKLAIRESKQKAIEQGNTSRVEDSEKGSQGGQKALEAEGMKEEKDGLKSGGVQAEMSSEGGVLVES
ncbi:hypothetical protein HDV00_007141 [Rhizophlyctis rosea]|nr:hypothetical protein HDV00_007141 [Rhizophlyctis rosea]